MFRTPHAAIHVYPEDEDEEPWDQRRTKRSVDEDNTVENDGELPSLSSNMRPSGKQLLQQRGGDLEQRKFWGQLDTHSCDDDDDDDEASEDDSIRRGEIDDMPDDELIMSSSKNNKTSNHRALRNMPRQSDEQYEAGDDRMLMASGFCDSTLTALGDMCGAVGYAPTKKRVTLSPQIYSDVQEEHTAIEVEFVEEETAPARHHQDVSVESKNAFLSAMAAQAKEDFSNKKQGIEKYDDENGDLRQTRLATISPSLDDADAYETFNAAEKRKFIRLINTGANPREATHMILQERSTLKPEPPRKAPPPPESVLPKRSLSDTKRSHRSAVLFWKKSKYNQQNRSASAESLRPTVSEDDQDDLSSQQLQSSSLKNSVARSTDDDEEVESGERFAKSGIHFYDAERKEDKDDEALVGAPNTPSSVRSTRSEQLRKVGFKSLAERRPKKNPRVSTISTDQDDGQVAQRSSADDAKVRASPKNAARFSAMSDEDNDSMTDYDNILNTAEISGSFSKNASFDPEMTLDDIVPESTTPVEMKSDERSTDLYANARKQYAGLTMPIPASDESVYTAHTTDTGYTGVTGVTGVTTYSHSSRVRRPGAAKKRLAKEKELQEKAKGNQGWAQSIKEVAATTSQKWDPFLGWVDYLEPVVELPEIVTSQGNMHLDLTRKISTPSKKSKMDESGSVSTAKSAPLPFPPEWEEERERMLRETEKNERLQVGKLAYSPDVSRNGIPNDGSRPNSWIESMKAASASLVKDGKQWDPEKGWVNDDGTSVAISTDGDFTAASTAAPPPPSVLTTEQARQSDAPESPVVMDRIGAAPVGKPESYVQLGDTGSVRSVHQDLPTHATSTKYFSTQQIASVYESTYVSDDDTDVDSVPLPPNGAETFPNAEREAAQSTANVNVVKERINNEDMGLFASGNNKNMGHTGRNESFGSEGLQELFAGKQQDDSAGWGPENTEPQIQEPLQKHSATEVQTVEVDKMIDQSSLQSKASGSNGRRGDGPVDLDELEDEEEHDAKSAFSFGTDARSTFSTNTDGKSIASFKLKNNARDTSPMTRRRQAEKSVVTPSPVQVADERKKAERAIFKDRNTHATVASHELYDQEMVDRHHYSSKSYSQDEAVSPGVRNTVAEWESRAIKPEGSPSSPSNSAEWKVFLAKKVRAERDASSGVVEGGTLNMPRQLFRSSHDDGDGCDDDSIFDFKSAVNAQSEDGVSQNAQGKQNIAQSKTGRATASRFIAGKGSSQTSKTPIKSDSVPLEDISHLSPINSRDEEDAGQDHVRDIPAFKVHGTETAKRVNFFQRLTECTGPVMTQNRGIPSSHLSFLQNNICGRPDDVHEDTASEDGILDEDIEKLEKGAVMDDVANISFDDGADDANLQRKTDSKLDVKLLRSKGGAAFGSNRSSAGSSVISEGSFGAKTAYLEAIAMKAAVAKPRSRSRARSTSASSVVSTASTAHSEKWKAFLERKKAGGATPSVISKASDKHTDERYKEMLSRLKSSPRQVEADELSQSAKDLSGAKVEALMAQLTGSNVSEAEI